MQQRKLLQLVNGYLVDSNMFVRSLVLSQEHLSASEDYETRGDCSILFCSGTFCVANLGEVTDLYTPLLFPRLVMCSFNSFATTS